MKIPATFSPEALDAAKILGFQIRVARHEQNLTGQQLADRAGVSRRAVSQVESADPAVSLGSALTIAAAAGVPLFDEPDPRTLRRVRNTMENFMTLLPSNVHNRKEPGVSTNF